MSRFNIGDKVFFNNCQMAGEIEFDNQDGTYSIIWEAGNMGGRMTVTENDIELQ